MARLDRTPVPEAGRRFGLRARSSFIPRFLRRGWVIMGFLKNNPGVYMGVRVPSRSAGLP